MAWSRIQGTFIQAGAVFTANLSFGATVTGGNIVVGSVLCPVETWPTSIVDDKGNIYNPVCSQITRDAGASNNAVGFISQGPITNGPLTVTVTLGGPGAASFLWIIMDEFHYSSPLTGISIDGYSCVLGGGVLTTPAWTSYNSNNLIYSTSASTGSSTAGAGFTNGTNPGTNLMSEFLTQTSPSNTNVGAYATQTGSTWITAFAVTPAPATTWQVVQQFKDHDIAATSSKSFTAVNSVGTGNLIVCTLAISDATFANLTSIVDDKGNNYLPSLNVEIPPAFAAARGIFWLAPINHPKTITVTCSSSQAYILLQFLEVAPPPNTASIFLDGFTSNAPAASPSSPPAFTPTIAGDFFYSVIDAGGAGAATNGGTPAFSQGPGWATSWCQASVAQPAVTSTTCQWFWNTGNAQAGLAAFGFIPGITNVGGKQLTEEDVRRSAQDWADTDQARSWFSSRAARIRWK